RCGGKCTGIGKTGDRWIGGVSFGPGQRARARSDRMWRRTLTQPLEGIRVADFSHVMAGPFASHLLRLMGAEVIKIEPKSGDQFRNYGADRRFDGMSPAFIAANAGKKSIALDLKDPNEQDIARRIVQRSDVLLENFRPGVIERLGLSYETVKQFVPDIVYCSV